MEVYVFLLCNRVFYFIFNYLLLLVTRKQLYLAFSIYTNGEKLFKCQRTKSTETLDCLNGIRALSIIWIILGHRFVMTLFLPVINLADVPLVNFIN